MSVCVRVYVCVFVCVWGVVGSCALQDACAGRAGYQCSASSGNAGDTLAQAVRRNQTWRDEAEWQDRQATSCLCCARLWRPSFGNSTLPIAKRRIKRYKSWFTTSKKSVRQANHPSIRTLFSCVAACLRHHRQPIFTRQRATACQPAAASVTAAVPQTPASATVPLSRLTRPSCRAMSPANQSGHVSQLRCRLSNCAGH